MPTGDPHFNQFEVHNGRLWGRGMRQQQAQQAIGGQLGGIGQAAATTTATWWMDESTTVTPGQLHALHDHTTQDPMYTYTATANPVVTMDLIKQAVREVLAEMIPKDQCFTCWLQTKGEKDETKRMGTNDSPASSPNILFRSGNGATSDLSNNLADSLRPGRMDSQVDYGADAQPTRVDEA